MNYSIWVARPWVTKKNENVCKGCRHFYQHYTRDGHELPVGHCTHPRNKDREETDTCQYFEERRGR